MVKDIMWRFMLSKRAGSYVRTMSWLSVTSVSLSLAALIIITSVMSGFNDSMLKKIVLAEPDLVIVKNNNENEINQKLDQLKLKNRQNVSHHDVIVKTIDGSFGGAIAKGMSQNSIRQFVSDLKVSDVRSTLELGRDEVILGNDLARSLGVITGDEIVVLSPDVLIKNSGENFIYDKVIVSDIFSSEVQNLDKNLMIYEAGKTFLAAKSSTSYSQFVEVQLDKPFAADKYKKKLKKSGLDVESWGDRNGALIMALKLEKIAMTTFLTLGAIITSFSIATVLILLINQKKREWGIFMSMGLSRLATRRLFSRIGFYLSALGIVAGFVVGVGVSLFLKIYKPQVLPDFYYDRTIPLEINPLNLLVILGLSFVVAFTASFVPAHIYSRRKPYESIKS